jgi:general secretion pathway protein B
MSYILEALKKAQAERQIGSTPTIHAPTLAGAPARQGASARRAPVIVAMVLMASAIAGLATMLVRQQQAGVQQPTDQQPIVQQPIDQQPIVAAPAVPIAATPTAPASPTGAPQAIAADALPAASPPAAVAPAGQPPAPQRQTAARAEAPPATAPEAAAPAKQERAASDAGKAPQVAAAQQTGGGTSGAKEAAAAPPPAPVEEYVQSMHELPEPIQRAIPQITFGGYMYSKNPADRLLVIDKVLRKEGEEVAPGLVLLKLQPKQAVFGFRGYRYRVPL